jgi:hypothetical protein
MRLPCFMPNVGVVPSVVGGDCAQKFNVSAGSTGWGGTVNRLGHPAGSPGWVTRLGHPAGSPGGGGTAVSCQSTVWCCSCWVYHRCKNVWIRWEHYMVLSANTSSYELNYYATDSAYLLLCCVNADFSICLCCTSANASFVRYRTIYHL